MIVFLPSSKARFTISAPYCCSPEGYSTGDSTGPASLTTINYDRHAGSEVSLHLV